MSSSVHFSSAIVDGDIKRGHVVSFRRVQAVEDVFERQLEIRREVVGGGRLAHSSR